MILADKIINERKKNGWSQEELAEQLSVSRQSVSKWEGSQAVPDLQKIVAMADIFGVSTDYLLKDEIEVVGGTEIIPEVVEIDGSEELVRVSLEEANSFINISKENAPKIAAGVSLCILSPVVLIFLAALSDLSNTIISENAGVAIGVLVLLVMVAVAVAIFILCGAKTKKFEYLEKCRIETAYGVAGMVQEKKAAMEGRRTLNIAIGVMLCILGPVPLIFTSCMEGEDSVLVAMVCVLLVVIAIAVNLFVRTGIEWGSYEKLLQEGEYTVANKNVNNKAEAIGGVYWSIVLAGYLGWSFITMRWDLTWIVWPVAAILFGVVRGVVGVTAANRK